jgi:hypothetical protein
LAKPIRKSVDLTNVSAGEGIIAHTIDFQGDTGTGKNDTLTGTSNDELFVAGLGDDILKPLLSPAFSPLITKPPVPDVQQVMSMAMVWMI